MRMHKCCDIVGSYTHVFFIMNNYNIYPAAYTDMKYMREYVPKQEIQ